MPGNFNVAYTVTLIDRFSSAAKKMNRTSILLRRNIREAGQSIKKFGKSTYSVGRSLRNNVTLPLMGLGALSGVVLFKFETQMNNVKAITESTGEQFLKLRNQARLMGRTTRFTASEAAAAQAFLAKAGFKVNQIYSAMPDTLQLAAAANLDIATSADIVSNVMKGYRLRNQEVSKAVDVLTKTFVSSNTDLSMLGEAFKYAGPVAKGFGLSIQETTAFLGLLGNAGIQASMAGTTLRGALSKLASPSKKAAKMLEYAGIKVFDSSGKMMKLHHILAKLSKAGAKASHIMEIFGLRAGPGMIALGAESTKSIEKFIKTLEKSSGTAKRIAKTQLEGLPGAMLLTKSAIEDLIIALGDAGLTSVIIKFANWITKSANYFSQLPPKTKKIILVLTGLAAILGPLIMLFGALVTSLGIATIGFTIFWAAVTAPISLIIGGIMALIGLGVYLYKKYKPFRDLMDKIASVISKLAKFSPLGIFKGKGLPGLVGTEEQGKAPTGLAEKAKADKSIFQGRLDIFGAPKGSVLQSFTKGNMPMNVGLNMEGAY